MPMYRIKCPQCLSQKDIFLKMSEYDNLPEHCGGKTERVICAPAVHTDITPYISPGTGKEVSSRSQQREDLLKSNAFIAEPGVTQDIARWKQEKADKSFAPIETAVDNTVRQLVNAGQLES